MKIKKEKLKPCFPNDCPRYLLKIEKEDLKIQEQFYKEKNLYHNDLDGFSCSKQKDMINYLIKKINSL